MEKQFLLSDFKQSICIWEILLKTLNDADLEKYKPIRDRSKLVKDYTDLDFAAIIFECCPNPIEQSICSGLFLSIYGEFEKCLMKLVEMIECKTHTSYNRWKKSKQHMGELQKIKSYVEVKSKIKFDANLFRQMLSVNRIRNIIIHNGSCLRKEDLRYKEGMSKYCILEEVLNESLWITVSQDLKHLQLVVQVFKDFLLNVIYDNEF